jgi:hypothetical protein
VPDLTGIQCRCEPPLECGQSLYPVCDGWCPTDLVCIADPSGQEACVCEQPIDCEQSLFPVCDGECPPPEICIPDADGGDFCVCSPPFECEQSPYPTCDGICPDPEICVPDPTGLAGCRCEPPEPPTCDATQAPVCGGTCPPNERCTPLTMTPGGPCECIPCVYVTPGPNIWIDWPNKTTLQWAPIPCAFVYNLYRLTLPRLVDSDSDGLADHYGFCFQPNLFTPQAIDGSNPPIGALHHYLVTGENSVGEGSLGFNSQLLIRPNYTPCP